ncbi:MAG: hypothetical protein WCF95_04680 [bacterium]
MEKMGNKNDEVKLFAADDMIGYSERPNYWGLEIKPHYENTACYPPKTLDLNIFQNKTADEAKTVVIDAYNELVKRFQVRDKI